MKGCTQSVWVHTAAASDFDCKPLGKYGHSLKYWDFLLNSKVHLHLVI